MIEVTKPRAIALGYFDGVHLGHRALMQKAVERAKQIGGTSAVFTFDVHPDSVVMGRQVPLLTANAYRREEIKQLIEQLQATYPDLKTKIFGAMQRLPLPEWGVQPHPRRKEKE